MKVYLAVEKTEGADFAYNDVVNKAFSTEEKAKEYMEQTNKNHGWRKVKYIDELKVE